MDNDGCGTFLAGFFLAFLICTFMHKVTMDWKDEDWQKDAVEHNKAEYVTEKGLPVWKWKEND